MNSDDLSTFETEHFKLAKKLYAKYGFKLELCATKKHDKFWAKCSHPVLTDSCMCGTSKYSSVDRVAEYEVLGHKTGGSAAAEKWCEEHECGGDGYFGCQVPFTSKIDSIIRSQAYWLHKRPSKYDKIDDMNMKAYGCRNVTCQNCEYWQDKAVVDAVKAFPALPTLNDWNDVRVYCE